MRFTYKLVLSAAGDAAALGAVAVSSRGAVPTRR